MISSKTTFTTIDEYISTFPQDVQVILEKVRKTIQKAAPQATETINYQMPTFQLHGNLVHFAGYKKHIGFYPTPSAITAFQKQLTGYKNATGSVQFPLDKPIPYDLIYAMVRFRVAENMKKEKTDRNI